MLIIITRYNNLVLISGFVAMIRSTEFNQCFPQICIGRQNILPRDNVIELPSLALSQND